MSTLPYKTTVEAVIENIWNQGNLSFVDRWFVEDLVYHLPFSPNTINGREGYKQWVVTMRTAFPDFCARVKGNLLAEGCHVSGRWMLSGTQLNVLAFFPATGHYARVEGMFTYRFEGSHIAEIWDMYDVFFALQQLGILPELDRLAVG